MDSSSPARLLCQLHTLLLGDDFVAEGGQSAEPQLQGAGQQQLLEQLIQVGNLQPQHATCRMPWKSTKLSIWTL
jgi:hypothetical protein